MINNIKAEVLHSVQLSKGKHTLPYLTLFELKKHGSGKKYVVAQHEDGKYPRKDDMFAHHNCIGNSQCYFTMEVRHFKVLNEALSSWKENKNSSLMCYSYLYAYCKAKGYDLHEDINIL